MKKYLAINERTAYLIIIKNGYVNWMPFQFRDEVFEFADKFLNIPGYELREEIIEALVKADPNNEGRFDDAYFWALNM